MIFKNLEEATKYSVDILRRLEFLEDKFESALGVWKSRKKEIYWRDIINTKENLKVLKTDIINIVKADTSAITGWKNQWYCSSLQNPILKNIPDAGLTILYSSLRDSNGKLLPANLNNMFCQVIHEVDRLVNVTYYASRVKLVPSTQGGAEYATVSLLVTQFK